MAERATTKSNCRKARQAQSRWFASAPTWCFVVELLDTNHRIILLDAHGRGASDKPPTGYSTSDYANDLTALIEAFRLQQPMLVGHSMGARVVAAFDAAAPGPARALVVIDPAMSGPGRRPYPIPANFYLNQRRQVLSGCSVAVLAKSAPTRNEARIRDRIDWLLPSCSEATILLRHAGFHNEGFIEAWSKVTAPALFIRGANSPVVEPSEFAEAQAANPRAEYVQIARSGHMVPWDNLTDLAETLDRYLKRFVRDVRTPALNAGLKRNQSSRRVH